MAHFESQQKIIKYCCLSGRKTKPMNCVCIKHWVSQTLIMSLTQNYKQHSVPAVFSYSYYLESPLQGSVLGYLTLHCMYFFAPYDYIYVYTHAHTHSALNGEGVKTEKTRSLQVALAQRRRRDKGAFVPTLAPTSNLLIGGEPEVGRTGSAYSFKGKCQKTVISL